MSDCKAYTQVTGVNTGYIFFPNCALVFLCVSLVVLCSINLDSMCDKWLVNKRSVYPSRT